MNVKEAIEYSKKSLSGDDASVDSLYLLSFVLQKNFTWLKTWPEILLSNKQENLLTELIKRRQTGEPIAYIVGEKGFWSLTLETNPSTLIPRPETELLVENALKFLKELTNPKILDLGTGTGAIALAIASERKSDLIIATDYIEGVVELAKRNSAKNNINNVKVYQSDWFSNIKEKGFDLIVSNPPYIEENDPHLKQGDLRFEPMSALSAKDNGFADIKHIIETARDYLKNGGCLMFEHGSQQADEVRNTFYTFGYSETTTVKDLAGLERITLGYFGK